MKIKNFNDSMKSQADVEFLLKENARLLRLADKRGLSTKLKKQRATAEAEAMIREVIESAKTYAPKPFKIARKKSNGKKRMLEINLTDHHFGKLAWGLETLHANYDTKIATETFSRAFHGVLCESSNDSYEEIWFVVGNDLFNADNTQGTTTSGTNVESDIRHEKTWVIVRTVIINAIEMLRHLTNKVKVIAVRGNHDWNTTFHLGDLLEVRFANYKDVEVDNRPCPRKYHVFGNTLIGYTHGDKEKANDLFTLMPTEARELFGKTLFHEWHIGHMHQTRVTEKNGIRVRILPALCPPDAWHAENGYVGNLRSTEALIWDKEKGLVSTIIYTDFDNFIEKASKVPSVIK